MEWHDSDLKLKLLDDLCDKLDKSGIEGNVIERDSYGKPYVNIWYGNYKDRDWQGLSDLFTVIVTDNSLYTSPNGCYEIKPPYKYSDNFNGRFYYCKSKTPGFYVMGSDQIIRVIKQLFDIEELKKTLKKEKIMSDEFTLETNLFDKLKEKGILYGFQNGVYNPEEIIILRRSGRDVYDVASVRSIPNSESTTNAYEVKWFNVPLYILAKLHIDKVKTYALSDALIRDILAIEKELRPTRVVLQNYPDHGIADVIFNDPATIIIWKDGSKTVVKAENEKFDPEKGLAMAISKKILGNKYDYYETFKKYVGRYKKQKAKMKGGNV